MVVLRHCAYRPDQRIIRSPPSQGINGIHVEHGILAERNRRTEPGSNSRAYENTKDTKQNFSQNDAITTYTTTLPTYTYNSLDNSVRRDNITACVEHLTDHYRGGSYIPCQCPSVWLSQWSIIVYRVIQPQLMQYWQASVCLSVTRGLNSVPIRYDKQYK